MTDKVQKIKDWISKEQDGLMDAQGNFEYPEHEGAYHILCNLDTYIDSLQEEPVSEELDDAAYNFVMNNFGNPKEPLYKFDQRCFRAGAQWQKKQTVAKAIDGVVTFDYYDSGNKTYGCVAHDSFCLEDFGLKDRDKVKVIVIKEE